jgi:hypothetical protein
LLSILLLCQIHIGSKGCIGHFLHILQLICSHQVFIINGIKSLSNVFIIFVIKLKTHILFHFLMESLRDFNLFVFCFLFKVIIVFHAF